MFMSWKGKKCFLHVHKISRIALQKSSLSLDETTDGLFSVSLLRVGVLPSFDE